MAELTAKKKEKELARLYGEAKQRMLRWEEQLRVTHQVSNAIASAADVRDIDELPRQVVEIIKETFDYYFVGIALLEGDELVYKSGACAAREKPPPGLHLQQQTFVVGGESIVGGVAASGQPALIGDVRLEDAGETVAGREETANDRCGEHSLLAVPLKVRERVVGVMVVESDHLHALDDHDLRLMQSVANQVATSLENARLQEIIERDTERLLLAQRVEELTEQKTFDVEIARTVTSTLDLQTVFERVMHRIREGFKVERGSLLLVDEETGDLAFAWTLDGRDKALEEFRLKIGQGIAGYVAQTGEPLIVPDVSRDPRFHAQVSQSLGFVTKSILCAPLQVKDRVIGVIQLLNKLEGQFSQLDIDRLVAIAAPVAIAIENARLYKSEQDRRHVADTLLEMSKTVGSTLDLNEVLETILDQLKQVVDYDSAAIMLLEEDAANVRRLSVTAGRGFADASQLDIGLTVEDHEHLSRPLRSRKPLIIADVHQTPSWEVVKGSEYIRSWMGVPLISGEKVIGLLSIDKGVVSYYRDEDAHLAAAFANQAAIAIEHARLFADLQKVNEELIEANEAKTQFVSVVSHELRTPMTSIKGYTDMLMGGMVGDLNDNQRRFLGIIRANAERLSHLVNELLEISRIEAGRLKLHFEPLRLPDIVSEVIASLEKQIAEKGLRVSLSIPDNLPLVFADRDRVTQVLVNLVSNAYRYTASGGQIIISVEQFASNNGCSLFIVTRVIDTGIGISPEDQAKLFSRFFRADHPVVREQGGTGLGLSIVKSIIEMHQGSVWVESELEVGSTFSFTLPLADST